MRAKQLTHIEEPELTFGNGQTAMDPRDGLLLFGTNEKFDNNSIRVGVIGRKEGVDLYSSFVKRLNSPIISRKKIYGKEQDIEAQRPSYPGFMATFELSWPEKPEYVISLDGKQMESLLLDKIKKRRTNNLVSFYADKIVKAKYDEDVRLDIWYVVVPRDIFIRCRYGSKGLDITRRIEKTIELHNQGQLSLYDDYIEELEELESLKEDSSDFHNLLKARLLQEKVETPVQIVVEPTLDFRDKLMNTRYTEDMQAHLAWTQSVALYYKLGKLPWVLNSIRDDVCYVGLVFKQMGDSKGKKGGGDSVCSAAQMFLKDGDGTIFRGNIGLFKSEDSPDYHLDESNAEELLGMAMDDFKFKRGEYPKELFIHGRVRFEDEEWKGFLNAVESRSAKTQLKGIVIKDTRNDDRRRLKLFKDNWREPCEYGIMRGLAWVIDTESAYLFTRGYIPRIGSTNHLEISNPLYIELNRGTASIEEVLKDVLALTKLNYNACIYGDGLPVTLRFSDLIGNILTATSKWQSEMRQFRYYI